VLNEPRCHETEPERIRRKADAIRVARIAEKRHGLALTADGLEQGSALSHIGKDGGTTLPSLHNPALHALCQVLCRYPLVFPSFADSSACSVETLVAGPGWVHRKEPRIFWLVGAWTVPGYPIYRAKPPTLQLVSNCLPGKTGLIEHTWFLVRDCSY